MGATWDPEEVVGPELARELVRRAAPELADASVEPYGAGWDNTAYRVDGKWIFRFPRRAIAVALMEAECRLLPTLAARLPLAVPNPAFVGTPCDAFRWPYAGYRELEGSTACRAVLDRGERERAAPVLGRFLAALHAVPADDARALGTPPDDFRRLDLPYRTTQLRERFDAVRAAGLWDDVAVFERIVSDVPRDWTPRADTLCHGDLYSRHVLVDAAREPCGVIDWGDVHLGDGAVDLALVHGFLPRTAHDAFRAAYGAIDEASWRVGRFRALFSALATLAYAHDQGDVALLNESRTALAFLKGG